MNSIHPTKVKLVDSIVNAQKKTRKIVFNPKPKGSGDRWHTDDALATFKLQKQERATLLIRHRDTDLTRSEVKLMHAAVKPPVLRFESQGPTHNNPPDSSLPIHMRRVTTPHFHRFDAQGRSVAYKTKELEKKPQLAQSPQWCLQHFAKHATIQSVGGAALTVQVQGKVL